MQIFKYKIEKYHLWLLFFFTIFGGTFSMIVWTVKSAVETPVYEDKSFLSSYHIVDDNFNEIVAKNHRFKMRYDVKIKVNDRTVGMEFKDAFLGYRSLEKQSTNQDMLLVGDNAISIVITNKKSSQIVSDANISLQITRAIEDMYDIDLNAFKYENDSYNAKAKIDLAGNWNIIGKIQVLDDIGYLYIKSNTKK